MEDLTGANFMILCVHRTFADRVVPLMDRVIMFSFGFHWITYKGRPASTEEAPIIIATPHSSLIDVFAVCLFGLPSFVVRHDLRHLVIFGRKSIHLKKPLALS